MKTARPYITVYLTMAKNRPAGNAKRWLIPVNRPPTLFRGSWLGMIAGGGYKTRHTNRVSNSHGQQTKVAYSLKKERKADKVSLQKADDLREKNSPG